MLVLARHRRTRALYTLHADDQQVPYLMLDGLLWIRGLDRRTDAYPDRRYTAEEFYERFEVVGPAT